MAVNRDLLLKVKEKILAEPGQFQMELLFKSQEAFDRFKDHGQALLVRLTDVYREVPNCGTAACIAGWAVSIHLGENPDKAEKRFEGLETLSPHKLLGLPEYNGCDCEDCATDPSTHDRFNSLCYVSGWPEEQKAAWYATWDLVERARLAAEVIDLRLAQWAAEDATTEEEK